MRLLHTSDWHLGRTMRGQRPRDGDFDAVLAEITGIARDARPDLIVHSGDVFDSYRPGAPDLARCLRALERSVRRSAGSSGSGQPRLARPAGGPGFRCDRIWGRDRASRRSAAEVRRSGAASPKWGDPGVFRTRRGAADPGGGAAVHPPEQVPGRVRQPGQRTRDYARHLRESRPCCNAGCSTTASPARTFSSRRAPVRQGAIPS